jgi:hypothetical protein
MLFSAEVDCGILSARMWTRKARKKAEYIHNNKRSRGQWGEGGARRIEAFAGQDKYMQKYRNAVWAVF